MDRIEIRRATANDAATLARLNAFVHEPHVEAHPHYFRATDASGLATLFRASLDEPETAAFVALSDDGEAVGYMVTRYFDRAPTALHHRRRYLEIDQIAVDPDHRRGGIARALVTRAREEAEARGTTWIHLATWAFNVGAQAFFESEGFTPRTVQYWEQIAE